MSEKAANIARSCRAEAALFELLVEEKTGTEKNAKFVQDFKTLTIRHDLSSKFPQLESFIFGEESNKFTNTLGETILVTIQENESKTKDLLSKVLNGNEVAAAVLAKQIHADIKLSDVNTDVNIPEDPNFDLTDLGIWIDPIDATSQYIKGGFEDCEEGYPPTKGLKVRFKFNS